MTHWWQNAIIYQIYPRSFCDSNGDGVGDLKGIHSKLPYVKSLGVDGIWISPFYRSPMKDFGYDIQDYCDVDPLFGNLVDFDVMLAEAHELGLRVVIDLALSHTSNEHDWFLQSKADRSNAKADWYVWADPRPDGSAPNNWLAVFGGSAWAWSPKRQQYYLHNFLVEQPDLNVHNADVQKALLDTCEFWLKRGVDGFRLDVVNFLTHDRQLRDNPVRSRGAANPYFDQEHKFSISQPETLTFLKELRSLAESYGDIFLVGEIFDDDNIGRTAEYTEPSGPLHSAYSFAMLQNPLGISDIRRNLDEFVNRHPQGAPSWSFENHDVVRVVSRWKDAGEAPEAAKALLCLWAALPGTLFLYQGQELGLTQALLRPEEIQDPYGKTFAHAGRDGCRTPMPWEKADPFAGFSTVHSWLPISANHFPLAVDAQQSETQSNLSVAKELIRLRGQHPALNAGQITEFLDDEGLIKIVKLSAHSRAEIWINLSRRKRDVRSPDGGTILASVGASVREGTLWRLDPFGFGLFG